MSHRFGYTRRVFLGIGLGVLSCVCMSASGRQAPSASCGDHVADARHLIAAVRDGDPAALRRLAAEVGDVDACVPGDGTALIVAARQGDLAMVDALLDVGADPDRAAAGDGSPLIAAASAGNTRVIEKLLAAGAHVDAIVPEDETALISAVRQDRMAAVELLVGHGADVNLGAMANGHEWRSPLNQARSEAMRTYLLRHGAVAGRPG
jgi:ankyrin repeat protein